MVQPMYRTMEWDGVALRMQVNTGSLVTIITWPTYTKYRHLWPRLQKTTLQLTCFLDQLPIKSQLGNIRWDHTGSYLGGAGMLWTGSEPSKCMEDRFSPSESRLPRPDGLDNGVGSDVSGAQSDGIKESDPSETMLRRSTRNRLLPDRYQPSGERRLLHRHWHMSLPLRTVKAVTISKCFKSAGFVSSSGALEDYEQSNTVANEALITDDMWSGLVESNYMLPPQTSSKKLSTPGSLRGSTDAFEFTALLHPYWRVADVRHCTLSGCRGVLYADKTKDFGESREERECVTVSQWTDNIYKSTERVHKLTPVGAGKILTIEKENLPDTVVWNPWAKMASELEDFGSEEYLNMLCVEPGHVARPLRLRPAQRFNAVCTFTASEG
ncbi:hypothetical protein HPB50_023663 [Hyalomma asiaticum]|uniref:Uncharacterized protein n=1 Tax=Hyalomma asiaticum TaxID=266040 RepID=A0ACB7T8X3_HYAAI|nr:hypothetical protein HPB50_023663 [Hyalomma asiaticum]